MVVEMLVTVAVAVEAETKMVVAMVVTVATAV